MDKIVTYSSSTTQWQTLVTEASQACSVTLSENLESYLVFLLMRFTDSPQLAQNVMALEFFHSTNKYGVQRSQALRDVGDQCLLYSGLFPGRARRRRVRVSYYVNIGKSAYLLLSNRERATEPDLFATLAQNFVSLMDILQSMREVDNKIVLLDPIQAEELWRDTGSNHALQNLQQATTRIATPINSLHIPPQKH